MDDLQIIELYFSRNETAIKETDKKYGRLCFNIAMKILSNGEDSEECVNDTYLGVWNKIPPTRPHNFRAFICKITRNLSLKRADYNHAMKRHSDLLVSFSELENVLPDYSIVSDIDNEGIGKAIGAFLLTEKEETRNVFVRKYFFFDSISEIAQRYSFSESKVKSMLQYTRERLKKYLEKEGIAI